MFNYLFGNGILKILFLINRCYGFETVQVNAAAGIEQLFI